MLVDVSGRDRSRAHADIAAGLAGLANRTGFDFILDGEINTDGDEAHFNALDLLFADDESLVRLEWTDRRKQLEALFRRRRVPDVSLDATVADGDRLLRKAERSGWRGVFAVDPSSEYVPGKRTRSWIAVPVPSA